MISDHSEDSNKQMNEVRESIQDDLPKNITIVTQQGRSGKVLRKEKNLRKFKR